MLQSLTPLDVPTLASGVRAIANGDAQACAATETGATTCWGTTDFRFEPIDPPRPPQGSGVCAIALGGLDDVGTYGLLTVQCETKAITFVKKHLNGVQPALMSAAVQASQNQSVVGQRLTFTADLISKTGRPTGIVSFHDLKKNLGDAIVRRSKATYSTARLDAGSHRISTIYYGSGSFTQSTHITHIVNPALTTASLGSSQTEIRLGDPVVLTAKVLANAPSHARPTGKIVLMEDSTILKTERLEDGRAKIKISNLSLGSHTIIAKYRGNKNFGASASPPLGITIVP
jgi:hypothetical protein